MPQITKDKKENDWDKAEEIASMIQKNRTIAEEERASQYAKSLGLPYLDLNIFPIDQETLRLISQADAEKYGLVVLRKDGQTVKLASIEPENRETRRFIEEFSEKNSFEAEIYVVSTSSIKRAWENYERVKLVKRLDLMRMKLDDESLSELEKEIGTLADLEKKIALLSTTEILNVIIAGAIKMDSSDIHFEPQREGIIRLRYRIDGVLQDIADFPSDAYATILSRIKMLSGMMINVRDIPQDGRFSVKRSARPETDIRVSVLPGNYGESIVMRLLSQDVNNLDIKELGLSGLAYERLISQSNKKQGMILNSGPTGSGKTTTLYSLLNRINTPDKKIITIENPVEYQLKGIVQTQVEEDRGYDFANGLRSIVRQDPDVLLVGEIRDEESAEIATQAALTGHLVLSTIHSNNAAGVISRLIDLGIKPSLITASLNASIAQRLVRRLCPYCKEEYEPAQETIDILKKMIAVISPKSKVEVPKDIKKLWRAKGCPKCQGIGYKGRIAIFEIMELDEDIMREIEAISPVDKITQSAMENGMMTMEQDGILKALSGITSLEEVQRVIGQGDYLIRLYEKIITQSLSRGLKTENKYFEEIKGKENDEKKLREILKTSSTQDIVKYVLASALALRAGDIHIEPGEKEYKIRYRIDGVLQDIVKLPMTEFLPFLNEIKILSGFKIETRQGVTDGRFRIELEDDNSRFKDKKVDVRVSIILGGFGDIIVMRLLNQSAQATKLDQLNFHPLNLLKIKEEISKPNGIIINTGPTGSGKTTTLYSILDDLNKPEVKIITVEDPIEYQIEGIIQTQIDKEKEYTFGDAMKALLRQNPDIMMIGEIRDEETAKIAYQAALTGHLVLTTLHANSAAGAVQRLNDLELDLDEIASGTNCFIAQRLARRLCPKCKKRREATSLEREEILEVINKISPKTGIKMPEVEYVYDPAGCQHCHNIGYVGRIVIAEILQVDKEMEKFIVSRPTISELENKAMENGMITIQQDGYLRVLEGETSLEEIGRVAGRIKQKTSPKEGNMSGLNQSVDNSRN
jgi:type II secretory ATPase GspE/PulE/Tfp pilus assembly ATPase PilB-like protein